MSILLPNSPLITPANLEALARKWLLKHHRPYRYVSFKVQPHVAAEWWPRQERYPFTCIGTLLQLFTDIYEVVSIEEDYDSRVGQCSLVKAQVWTARPVYDATEVPVEFPESGELHWTIELKGGTAVESEV